MDIISVGVFCNHIFLIIFFYRFEFFSLKKGKNFYSILKIFEIDLIVI